MVFPSREKFPSVTKNILILWCTGMIFGSITFNQAKFLNFTYPTWTQRIQEKKEEIWLSPMIKAPTPTEMSKGQSDNTNNATKKFD